MSPTDIERAANHYAAAAAARDIDNIADFIAGALSGRYSIDADAVTPDEIRTPYADLVRRADGWYSKPLSVTRDLSIGTASYLATSYADRRNP